MKRIAFFAMTLSLLACNRQEAPAPAAAPAAVDEPVAEAAPPPGPESRPDFAATVAGVAVASKDHTTLVAALKAADLVVSLASPGGAYTVFAPTNEAFAKLPAGTVEGLLKPEQLGALQGILKHHAMVPVRQAAGLKDGELLSMSDGGKVTVHVQDGKVSVDGANVIASVQASNGVVHVVDAVLVPKAL